MGQFAMQVAISESRFLSLKSLKNCHSWKFVYVRGWNLKTITPLQT